MLGQRKPYDLPLTLANAMSDVVTETMSRDYPKITHYHEVFDFVPGNRSLSAVEVSLVNVNSRETVLKQYVDNANGTMTTFCCTALPLAGYAGYRRPARRPTMC